MRRTLSVVALLFTCAALAAATPGPDRPDEQDAIEQLRANVRYWEGRGRTDKAVEVWEKILRSDPNDADALSGLALAGARAGHTVKARAYLERLERAHPQHPGVAVVRQALGLGARYGEILEDARRLAREGKVAEAVATYRKLFGSDPATGAVGLEFYQTLGGTPEGWQEALTGLERLAAADPGSARYGLALARHLTYREDSRRAGITRLAELAERGNAEAARAWHQALLWLDVGPRDVPMLRAYLGAHPEDGEVRARLAALEASTQPRPVDVRGERIASAYEALGKKDSAQAEALFNRALAAKKNDVDALVGLASLALQAENFDRARELLQRVRKLAPRRRDLWERSLESAEFWAFVNEAKAAAQAGRHDEAEAQLDRAMKRSAAHADDARLVLAGVYAVERRYPEAEALYSRVLEQQPGKVAALRGLVEVYLATDRAEKALQTNETLTAASAADAYDVDFLESEVLRHQAAVKRAAGETQAARTMLDAAHARAPKNRRVGFDLAYADLELGDAEGARRVADELRQDAPTGDRDVLRLRVWLLNAEGRYGDALEALGRIKEADRDPPLKALARKLEVQTEALVAVRQAQHGKGLAARHKLAELQRRFGTEPDLLALVAIAFADLGAFDQSLALMYEALAAAPEETPTLKLQLASILHRARRDDELLPVLRELGGESDLSPSERRGLADLQIAYAVRRADDVRERGSHTTAYNILAMPLERYPDDARLLNALGRLYVSAGDFAEASKVFERVLSAHPDSVEAREGAIRTAVETDRPQLAAKLRDEGLARLPNEPRMHLAAARMAVLLGEDGQAMDAYERALALEVGQTGVTGEMTGPQADRALISKAASRFGDRAAASGKADVTLHDEISAEIAALEARHTVRFGVGFDVRSRQGEPGLGQLIELRAPITLAIPAGYKVRLTFAATPVTLLAGELDLDAARFANLFGTSGVTPDLAGGAYEQSAAGVRLDATLSYESLTLMAGASPLGFARQTAVGRLDWRDRFGDVGLALTLSRDTVADSLLSYAGAQDVLTGAVWGGVTKNGGRVDLGVIIDDASLFLFGGAAVWLGQDVPLNWSVETGLGMDWRLYDWGGTTASTGLAVSGLLFDQNLRHFTYGQGGYFSPQRFLNVSVPVRWRRTDGDLTWALSADLGVNWFSEEATPYFPTDPARQAARAELLDPDTEEPLGAYHASQSSFAFAFAASGTLGYKLSDAFALGLRADVHTGHDYVEFVGGLWASYTFDRKVKPADSELSPFGGQ